MNPSPETPKNMENKIISRQEYYSSSSTKTTTFRSNESRIFANGMFSTDSVDGCLENGHQRCVTFESKRYITNGSNKTISETASYKEFSNGIEKKSFIQQRVERLYGPGALAHGFFVSRRQKDRLSESESQLPDINGSDSKTHSKSMTDNLLQSQTTIETNLTQSTSSNSVLPVLRHLRPEFRAQLDIVSSKKLQNCNGKSDSSLKDEIEEHIGSEENSKCKDAEINGNQILIEETVNGKCEKDGHYFLQIIETETRRLLQLAEKVEKEELEISNLSEEIKGKLRAASGKARLLTSQKMQQFKGLCTKNITQNESEAFPTTSEDLQGFWDMVLLQVEQINALFAEIDAIRENDWNDPKPVNLNTNPKIRKQPPPRKIKSTTPTTNSVANDEIRRLKEAQRKKMIDEKRKAMRVNTLKAVDSIEFFVSESS